MKHFGISALAAMLLLAVPGAASAINIGFHVGFGSGTMDVTWDDEGFFTDADVEFDVDYFQAGFTLDTGRQGKMFQYRLHAGYHALGDGSVPDDQTGIGIDNHFGFAFNPGSAVRVWAGPSVYVGVLSGDFDSGAYFGAGATLGVDIPVGDGPKLGLELSYRVAGHVYDDFDSGTSDDIFLRAAFLF